MKQTASKAKSYNKLIRDKIPELLKQSGKTFVTHRASEKEYWEKLKLKLLEEVYEFSENDNTEELADILEIVDAICEYKKINKTTLQSVKNKKMRDRGKFTKRIILKEVK